MRVDHKAVDVEVDEDNTRIFHVFELWIAMNDSIKNSGLNGDSNADLCDAGAEMQ